VTMKKFIC